jgi:hypothetical protein
MDLHYFGSGYAEGHEKSFNPHSATTMSGQAMFRTNVKKYSSKVAAPDVLVRIRLPLTIANLDP